MRKFCLLLSFIFLFSATVFAKELPEIVWPNNVYGVKDKIQGKENWHLLDDNGRALIAEAVFNKLKAQEKEGKLPFKIKVVESDWNTKLKDVDSPIAIIPIVTTAATFCEEYDIGQSKLYKYVLVSAVDIAFCSVESEGTTLRLLGNIPLHYYTVLPENNNPDDMKLISPQEQRDLFARFTVKTINDNLDFSKYKKMMRHLEDKTEMSEATYQVTDVKISSAKANEIFKDNNGARIAYIKKIVGDIFSSAYASRTGHVVYPSLLSGNWSYDAVKGVYSSELNTAHAGDIKMEMKKPDKEITLDVTGIGKKEVETKKKSNINGFMTYKVWLAKSPKEDEKEIEVTNSVIREFDRYHGENLGLSDHDIFRMLLIGAAQKLGSQKLK